MIFNLKHHTLSLEINHIQFIRDNSILISFLNNDLKKIENVIIKKPEVLKILELLLSLYE